MKTVSLVNAMFQELDFAMILLAKLAILLIVLLKNVFKLDHVMLKIAILVVILMLVI
jgi:hypothetical protein